MLGSLLRAAAKVAITPAVIAKDIITALPESAEGRTPFRDTATLIGSIAEDLDEIA